MRPVILSIPYALVFLSALLVTLASGQTQLFESIGAGAGDQTGASLAFGRIDDPSDPNGRAVIAIGQPFATPAPNVKVFDAAGNLLFQTPAASIPVVNIPEFGTAVAFGRLAPALTPNDILLIGAPGISALYGNAGLVVLNTPTPTLPAIFGTQAMERFGQSVAVIGDITGDGIADFAVGAPYWDNGGTVDAGRVRIYRGGGTYTHFRDHVYTQANAHFGWAVAGVGDINADGVPDYAVGIPDHDNTLFPDRGRIQVYSGLTGLVITSLTKNGAAAGERLGFAVAGCGDVNGDGRPDYMVGVPGSGPLGFGRTDVYSGVNGALLHTKSAGSFNGALGSAVAGGHDVDRDGAADFMAGAPGAGGGKGTVFVYSGRTGQTLFAVSGKQNGENLGKSVAMGRLDPDGYAEFAVGRPLFDAPSMPSSGAATVFTGAVRWRLESSLPNFGRSVDVAGDVNGDGFDDIIVGAGSLAGTNPSPKWQLFDGRTSQMLRESTTLTSGTSWYAVSGLADITGDGRAEYIVGSPGDRFVEVRGGLAGGVIFTWSEGFNDWGRAVDDAGDLNGDGFHDILVGAPLSPNSNPEAGGVWVFSGANGALLHNHYAATISWLGHAVAGVGDVNGDGINDYIAGAPRSNVGGFESGMAVINSGASNTPVASILGASGQNAHCGWSVDGLGDVNGDGFADVIVGEPDFNGAAGAGCGRARVFMGGSTGVQVLYTIEGQGFFHHCGRSVAGVGDVDRDGRNDFAIGTPDAPDGATLNAGIVRVYSGRTGTLLVERAGATGEHRGVSVAGALTAGADGRNEVVIGANGFGIPDHVLVVHLPEAATETIGPGGCTNSPILVTGTGACAAMPNGCAVAQDSSLEAPGLPILGQEMTLRIAGAPANGVFYPFASLDPAFVTPIGAGCLLYLDVNAPIQLPSVFVDAAGGGSAPLLIPNQPAIAGVKFLLQGLVFPAAGGYALSNGLRLTIGWANFDR